MASMLFARLRKRIQSHDWLAVGIDFAIVAVGVFLGIEAANWNQARQDRTEERRYYAQIVEDVRTDLATLEFARDRSIRFDQAAEQTLLTLRSGIPDGVTPGRFAAQIHYAGFLYLPRPARRTYDELISTGNVGLLRDAAAKAAIAEYYAMFEERRQWDDLLRRQQGDYWRVTAGVLPRTVLQGAIRSREPALSEPEAAAILQKARKRPEIGDLLTGMAAHQERVRRDSEDQAEEARKLIRLLEPLSH